MWDGGGGEGGNGRKRGGKSKIHEGRNETEPFNSPPAPSSVSG